MAENEEDFLTKQQAVLETFFIYIGRFSFDKAKEFVERERDVVLKSHHTTQFFTTVLIALAQLASAEKNYYSLIFLGPKGFLRKDSSLKSMYESLRNEFQRLEDKRYITPVSTPTISPTLSCRTPSPINPIPFPSPSISSHHSEISTSALSSISIGSSIIGNFMQSASVCQGAEMLDHLSSHLCGQLYNFVCARMEIMELYEKACAMSSWRFMKFDQLLNGISDIIKVNQKLFHHPLLSPLKTSFSFECEILIKLLEAQVHLQHWRFLPTLLCLQEAHSKLGAWTSIPKEGKRGSLIITVRLPVTPPLYHWLCSLKAAVCSKFTLYFHDILSKQTSLQEMKNLCSKTTVDYFHKIVSFQKRYDAVCVAIVLDTNGLEDYRGHGYSYPEKYYEAPKGLDSFPAIICSPSEKPMSHWPSVVMIMNNKDLELKNSENVVSFYDTRVNSTYFLYKVEARMTLVIIFESKKSERDAYIPKFMQSLCSQLRCNKIFACLKPGTK